METRYDYALSGIEQYVDLRIIRVGDLVWYGGAINIGDSNHLGIIIKVDYCRAFDSCAYYLYAKGSIMKTSYVFPIEF